MAELGSTLQQVEHGLRALRRQALTECLLPGRAESETAAALGQAGLSASAEVTQLYAWHDGTDLDASPSLDDVQLFPGFYFCSLEETLANYRAFRASDRWNPGWLPVFANGGGDFYVLDLASGSRAGAVRHFRIDEAEHPIEFDSLADMMVTIAAALQRGVVFVDQDGYLEWDDEQFAVLAAHLNPNVPWWTEPL